MTFSEMQDEMEQRLKREHPRYYYRAYLKQKRAEGEPEALREAKKRLKD